MKGIAWEYMLEEIPTLATRREVEDKLGELGWSGWELCGIDYGCWILKRPHPNQPAE